MPGEKTSHSNVSTENFERQIQYLSEHYTLMHLHEYVTALREGRRIPSETAVITFDDGYETVYSQAFPILKKYGVPATVFLSVDFVDSGKAMWDVSVDHWVSRCDVPYIELNLGERRVLDVAQPAEKVSATYQILQYLNDQSSEDRQQVLDQLQAQVTIGDDQVSENLRPLNWEQVREMSGNGITIGSHAMSHSDLTRMEPERMAWEVTESRRVIEARAGIDADLFDYPGGAFNEEVKGIVKSTYKGAVAVKKGSANDDVYGLRRTGIYGPNTQPEFIAKLSPLEPLMTGLAARFRRGG
jgi:peptidoglycan/xylan/chitin deacetylase (PgdA/CDA1 family)